MTGNVFVDVVVRGFMALRIMVRHGHCLSELVVASAETVEDINVSYMCLFVVEQA